MSKFHLEAYGFAGFETLEEARAFGRAIKELADQHPSLNMIHLNIRDIDEKKNRPVEEPHVDYSNMTIGKQGCNARISQLANYAKKTTKISDEANWADIILKLDGNRYFVDEQLYIEICCNILANGVSREDFVNGIPQAK